MAKSTPAGPISAHKRMAMAAPSSAATPYKKGGKVKASKKASGKPFGGKKEC